MDDEIHIEGLEISLHIGVPEEERAAPQRLRFNLTLWPAGGMNRLGDDLERTVDYAAVCEAVKRFVELRRDKLIETMADGLALHLLEEFRIRRITIELRKFVQGRRDRLIETLADALARHLLATFAIRRITIELRKYILPEVEFVSVTVKRDQS